jgi:hypothetical protein
MNSRVLIYTVYYCMVVTVGVAEIHRQPSPVVFDVFTGGDALSLHELC